MITKLNSYRALFDSCSIEGARNLICEKIEDDIFTIYKKNRNLEVFSDRDIDITFLSLVHGDEVCGLDVQLSLISMIFDGKVEIGNLKICFALGNIHAYLENKRFVQVDLNRAFGNDSNEFYENQRAKKLERIFVRTKFLVDYHQTENYTSCPFLISRYDNESFSIFRSLMPEFPAVTYFGKNFTNGQMTTVNYQLFKGGKGFGIELGEKGFSFWQRELGISIATKLINHFVNKNLKNNKLLTSTDCDDYFANTYTFGESEISKTGNYELSDALADMIEVEKGQMIGKCDGKDLYAKQSGKIVFLKKYNNEKKVNVEIFRYLRPVSKNDLIGI